MKRNCYFCPHKFKCYTYSGLAYLSKRGPEGTDDCGTLRGIIREKIAENKFRRK